MGQLEMQAGFPRSEILSVLIGGGGTEGPIETQMLLESNVQIQL